LQDSYNLSTGKNQLNNNITSYLNNNTKLGKELQTELIRIQTELKNADAVGLKNLQKQFSNVKSEANALGQTGKSVFSKLSDNIKNFTGFLGAATITKQAIRTVQNMVSEVKNLDAAIVDLQMATGGSYAEVSKLMDSYIEMGKQLGATATEVASAASDYLRQGKSIAETNQLITDSLVLSKLGNISSADATTYLTTAMKGYGVAVDDVIGIVDKLSAIDLVSATDAGG
ncbi:phage tail tape measure protein, partial [Anaerosporobacter sp.]